MAECVYASQEKGGGARISNLELFNRHWTLLFTLILSIYSVVPRRYSNSSFYLPFRQSRTPEISKVHRVPVLIGTFAYFATFFLRLNFIRFVNRL